MRPFEADAEKLMSLTGPFFDLANPENPLEGIVYIGPSNIDTKLLLYKVLISVTSSVSGLPKGEVASPLLTLRHAPAAASPPKRIMQESTSKAESNGTSPVGYYGSAFAVGDFDADGMDDLVIGSYGVGEKEGRKREAFM